MSSAPNPHRRAVIGNSSNFWLHSTRDGGRFDLTHPPTPDSVTETRLDIGTNTTNITVDPNKTALVIIDMQNFFLSEALGRNRGAGHAACEQLEKYAIPAARKAGIQVIWLNWGLTDQDIHEMPPAILRAFGFEAVVDEGTGEIEETTEQIEDAAAEGKKTNGSIGMDRYGKPTQTTTDTGKDKKIYKGMGSRQGPVTLEDGREIDAGRMLMRDTWNAALYPPLDKLYEEGKKLPHKPDAWMHKNRMSGMWGATTMCQEYLDKQGLKTLLFAGVNTDQCVGGTMTDSYAKGYDVIMLSDACGTTSPEFSKQCIEFNISRSHGFLTTCEQLYADVEKASKTP